jgi:insertion element IS1 protein InsB
VLEATLLPAQPDDELELDELWSFVGNKKNEVWIWVALCRRTRQVVAWMPGDHSKIPCQALWDKVPQSYKHCRCYADGWMGRLRSGHPG